MGSFRGIMGMITRVGTPWRMLKEWGRAWGLSKAPLVRLVKVWMLVSNMQGWVVCKMNKVRCLGVL